VSPLNATSSGLPVWVISPCFMLAPRTSASVIARASSPDPGVAASISARKPVVWEFAMLLAITRCWTIDADIPEYAV
jgi:hypothetical protein